MRILALVVLLAGSKFAFAVPAPLSPSLYYEMGGGVSYQRPLNEATVAPDLTLGAAIDLPLSCDIWDVKDIAVANYPDLVVDYLEGQLDRLGQAVVAQLTSIGQGLAVAALQRALPGIYDLSQTLTTQISARVDIAKRSCEAVVNDINRGVNPLDPWKKIGTAVSWRTTLGGETGLDQPPSNVAPPGAGAAPPATTGTEITSILDAQRDVAANGEVSPIPWFGEELGGSSTNAIMIVRDLVTAGMNIMIDNTGGANEGMGLDDDVGEADIAGAFTAPAAPAATELGVSMVGFEDDPLRLGELFVDRDDAVDWANRFIGEQEIYLCPEDEIDACPTSFRPGVGLQSLVGDEVIELKALWTDILSADGEPTLEDLAEVSSTSVQVTVSLYRALMGFPIQDQNVYIGRLISDVALSLAVEKALAIRRLMLVSSESPVVKGYVTAAQVTDRVLERIRTEIEDTMWTVETQKRLVSGASETIITYDAIRRNNTVPVNFRSGRRGNTADFIANEPIEQTPPPVEQ